MLSSMANIGYEFEQSSTATISCNVILTLILEVVYMFVCLKPLILCR